MRALRAQDVAAAPVPLDELRPGAALMRAPAALLAPPDVARDGPADLPPPKQRRMIRRGSTGREVGYAQERFNAHSNAGLEADAIFGPLTQAAAKDYQHTHGLGVDAIIGPRTWASLDGPTSITTSSSGAGGSGGAGGPGSTVQLYDAASMTFDPPGTMTMQDVPVEQKTKQDAGELGSTVSVTKGITKGSDEELYVWNVLFLRADKTTWGSELDTITAIGPAPAGGGAAPLGQVTIRIDGAGNAEGVLVARGAPTIAATFKDVAEAKAALKADFGFSDVKDGKGKWTLEHLSKTWAALSRLPTDDRLALNGVQLIREKKLAGDQTGRFEAKTGMTSDGKKVIDERQLLIADAAFARDATSFVGGTAATGPASFLTIVHEAGHAVEKKAALDAKRAEGEAILTSTSADAAAAKAATAVKKAAPKADAAFSKRPAAVQTAAAAYRDAVKKATTAIEAFADDTSDADHPDTEKPAADAITARNAELAKLPKGSPAGGDFAKLSKAQDDWFAAALKRAAARAALSAKRTALAKAGGIDDSARMQAFVAFVTKESIPRLTKYAEDNWPGKPDEFFAEAYSLWLNDPEYLQSQAPKLKAWFDAGKHRI